MKILATSLIAISFLSAVPTTVQAATEDECAIWLCLPSGFPSGCGAAKSAFKKRIKKLKPPLPNILSCLAEGSSSTLNFKHDFVAVFDSTRTCKITGANQCIQWEITPVSEKRGQFCDPRAEGNGCNTMRYVEIFDNQEQIGSTYYW